ncbi:hypothetical protein WKI68_05450 [Streptomyces sp. MS1.HAVA.3]|uniref:Uncharacterized protein n=1 Tax=Streptomyces caledonius TaxID=3134107 RepID=A0ABU8TZL2_9ACTN
MPAPAPPPAPITLLLPDGQRLTVRLYERAKDREGPWAYRIGAPMWQCSGSPHIEAKEYTTWVTADVLDGDCKTFGSGP